MTALKLTRGAMPAHKTLMTGSTRGKGLQRAMRVMAMMGAIPLAGCITLEAPTEPIVIELNINITQEVIYRLADDASAAIEQNADIF